MSNFLYLFLATDTAGTYLALTYADLVFVLQTQNSQFAPRSLLTLTEKKHLQRWSTNYVRRSRATGAVFRLVLQVAGA